MNNTRSNPTNASSTHQSGCRLFKLNIPDASPTPRGLRSSDAGCDSSLFVLSDSLDSVLGSSLDESLSVSDVSEGVSVSDDCKLSPLSLLESKGSIGVSVISKFVPVQGLDIVMGVFTSNLLVALLCVGLSFFYGAGAIFLVILNASVFASFMAWVIRSTSTLQAGFAIMIHLIPEIIGFVLASIAGATLSWAILDERFGTRKSANVMRNAGMMLVVSTLFLLCGAIMEVYVTIPILYPMIG